MVRAGNSPQSLYQLGSPCDGTAQCAAQLAAAPSHARDTNPAQKGGVRHRKANAGPRYLIAGEPTEPTS
jgi:hypothetical protein